VRSSSQQATNTIPMATSRAVANIFARMSPRRRIASAELISNVTRPL
jgi:hypothetical protein